MTFRVDKTTGDSTVYTWNIANRLTRVDMPRGMVVEYVYGPLGRRLAKIVDGKRQEFRYDGEDLIMEMDSEDSIVASYTFGPGIDQPLAMNRNGRNYYYLADGLGSITAITDESGAPVQEYVYSVFGEIVEQMEDSIENAFTYTARELPIIGSRRRHSQQCALPLSRPTVDCNTPFETYSGLQTSGGAAPRLSAQASK